MILKMQCSIDPPSWHYVDHIEDLHFDVIQKKDEEFKKICGEKSGYVTRMVVISDNHIDCHSITIVRVDRLGHETKEWFITDAETYVLNDAGKTMECLRK